jgi:hypothetical protein
VARVAGRGQRCPRPMQLRRQSLHSASSSTPAAPAPHSSAAAERRPAPLAAREGSAGPLALLPMGSAGKLGLTKGPSGGPAVIVVSLSVPSAPPVPFSCRPGKMVRAAWRGGAREWRGGERWDRERLRQQTRRSRPLGARMHERRNKQLLAGMHAVWVKSEPPSPSQRPGTQKPPGRGEGLVQGWGAGAPGGSPPQCWPLSG